MSVCLPSAFPHPALETGAPVIAEPLSEAEEAPVSAAEVFVSATSLELSLGIGVVESSGCEDPPVLLVVAELVLAVSLEPFPVELVLELVLG